jgi:hypothetical protein
MNGDPAFGRSVTGTSWRLHARGRAATGSEQRLEPNHATVSQSDLPARVIDFDDGVDDQFRAGLLGEPRQPHAVRVPQRERLGHGQRRLEFRIPAGTFACPRRTQDIFPSDPPNQTRARPEIWGRGGCALAATSRRVRKYASE